MSITASPLCWPTGWKRTDAAYRRASKFGKRSTTDGLSYPTLNDITIDQATRRLIDELSKMRVDRGTIILSTNLKVRQDGLPYASQAAPRDPGVAVYWNDPETDAPRCIAIDIYSKVADNIAALAATIEAMRAIERHGGSAVMARAFTGFLALPAPEGEEWWHVLGLHRDAGAAQIITRYRVLAGTAHPDRGGTEAAMARLNKAKADGMKRWES